jgi:DNA-binding transcriptional ArsR family regulator
LQSLAPGTDPADKMAKKARTRLRVRPSMDLSVLAQLRKHDKACSMEEIAYRQSRLCRLLGNPVAFAIVRALAENDEMSPGLVANAVGRSVSRVSHILAALRLAEVVRYETEGRRTRYRLKHPREVRQILRALSEFVASASRSR